MIKIRSKIVLLFVFFVITLIAISSCAKSQPQCKTSVDCSSRKCFLSQCESGKCVYTLQRNCCGNRINETIEDGKRGNQCTCPEDYGKCEGKGKIKVGSRLEDAAYAHRYCNGEEQCVLGIERKDVIPQNFLDTINIGFFKASSVVKYNKPFDVARDNFEFKITLDDIHKDLVLPVRLTKIKILFSSAYTPTEQLIADEDLTGVLNGIGDEAVIRALLTLNYRPQEIEEYGSIRYSIDYSYTKKVASSKTANGTNIYTNEIARATFTAPAKPVYFVRNG